MATVVKEGDAALDGKTGVVCKIKNEGSRKDEGCGAVLKITFADLVLYKWYGTHFTHYSVAIKCPQCKKYVEVAGQVPDGIYNRLNTAKNRKKAVLSGIDES